MHFIYIVKLVYLYSDFIVLLAIHCCRKCYTLRPSIYIFKCNWVKQRPITFSHNTKYNALTQQTGHGLWVFFSLKTPSSSWQIVCCKKCFIIMFESGNTAHWTTYHFFCCHFSSILYECVAYRIWRCCYLVANKNKCFRSNRNAYAHAYHCSIY